METFDPSRMHWGNIALFVGLLAACLVAQMGVLSIGYELARYERMKEALQPSYHPFHEKAEGQ